MPLTPQPFTYGPVDIFVSTGKNGAPELLGFTEAEVSGELTVEHESLTCSVSGPRVEFDRVHLGESGRFSGRLAEYDHAVLNKLLTRFPGVLAQELTPNPIMGYTAPNRIGTLGRLEGNAITLWLRARYYSKAVFGARGMPPGFRFPVAYLTAGLRFEMSVMPTKYDFGFEVQNDINILTGAMLLYDDNMKQLPEF